MNESFLAELKEILENLKGLANGSGDEAQQIINSYINGEGEHTKFVFVGVRLNESGTGTATNFIFGGKNLEIKGRDHPAVAPLVKFLEDVVTKEHTVCLESALKHIKELEKTFEGNAKCEAEPDSEAMGDTAEHGEDAGDEERAE